MGIPAFGETPAQPPPRPQGLLFDEFAVGQLFQTWARTLTESDVVGFAGLSGDFNPLHVDEALAAGTAFRGRIAHGLLIEAIASGLAMQMGLFHGTIAALVEMAIGYRLPVRVGDTIRMRLTVVEREADPSPRRGWVVFRTEVMNQRDEVVLDGSWKVIVQRRRRQERGVARAPGQGGE